MPDTDVLSVVSRWNPQGMALLRALEENNDHKTVLLIGSDDANTAGLRTELARFEPQVPLGAPLREPPSTIGTATPPGFGASVALVLLDAGTALGAEDLAVLRRLRTDGIQVLLAMNGIHAHQDWRSVRDHDQALLSENGFIEPQIMPVSARMAVAAREAGDSALLDRSGLGSLHAALIAATGAVGAGSGDRMSAMTSRIVGETRERITEQIAELRSGGEVAQLRAERARLVASRDGGRTGALSTLRGQLHLARVDLTAEVGVRVRGLHTAARTELDRLGRSELRTYPERLQQALNEVTVAIDDDIEQRLTEMATRAGAPAETTMVRREPPPRIGPDPEPRPRGVEDHLMIALGASAGVGLGRLLVSPFALVPALDVASVPLALLLGAGVAAWVVRARRQLADRNHLRQWLADVVANVKAQLEQRVATALVEAENTAADQLARSRESQMVALDREVAELETRLRRLASEQPGRISACERDIGVIERWLSATER